jgi:dimethylaniline monooxygenase (N-oxide forming)
MKIAVIGGGISGIATAQILKKNGFTPVVFERSARPGGVWATAYPEVHLQNLWNHYHLSDFPWPFKPDFHPSGKQIMNYLASAIEQLKLDVRLGHEVTAMTENGNGWMVTCKKDGSYIEEQFDFVIISNGQYTQRKIRPAIERESLFKGTILTELDIKDLSVFNNKRVAVVGFGKSALDMATFATANAAEVHHVFRTPRWLLPEKILGMHFTRALFNRFGTVMMRSWVQPTSMERFLHKRMKFVVMGFWKLIAAILRFELKKHGMGKGKAARERLKVVTPKTVLITDIGSKTALAPESYLPLVAKGKINPYHASLTGFTEHGVMLDNGQSFDCDVVLLCLGFDTPQFPFLPQQYRGLLEKESDGAQLYRHIIHPHIPKVAFCGFNHGFLHVPTVEIGTQWICAYLRGELQLPGETEMERCMADTMQWKRTYVNFDPARSYSTSTRFHQYIDVLLKDMGVSPYRKMPNVFAEVFARYEAADYRGITEEYNANKKKRATPLKPLPVNT